VVLRAPFGRSLTFSGVVLYLCLR